MLYNYDLKSLSPSVYSVYSVVISYLLDILMSIRRCFFMDEIKNHLSDPIESPERVPIGSTLGLLYFPVFLGCLCSLFISVLPVKFLPVLNVCLHNSFLIVDSIDYALIRRNVH